MTRFDELRDLALRDSAADAAEIARAFVLCLLVGVPASVLAVAALAAFCLWLG